MKSYNSIKAELDALQNMLPDNPTLEQFGNLLDCKQAALKHAEWTLQRLLMHEAFKIANLRRVIVWVSNFGGEWRDADTMGEVCPQLGDIIIQEERPKFLPEGLYPHKTGWNFIWEVEEE